MTFFSRSFCVLFSVVLKDRPEELSVHAHTSGMMRWRLLRLAVGLNVSKYSYFQHRKNKTKRYARNS